MKRSLSVIVITALAVGMLATGCIHAGRRTVIEGSGVAASETRMLGAFSGIAIEGSGDAVVVLDGEPSIVIETDDNLLEYIETEVESGVLHLRLRHPDKRASFRTRTPIRYTITTASVNRFSIAGSGSVTCPGLEEGVLDVDIAGSGTVILDGMDCGTVAIDIAGSGEVRMSGSAEVQRISISGSGDIASGELRTERTRIDVAGSGDATVWVTERLNVSVAGSGEVRYYGSPSLSKSIGGIGTVRHLGDKPVSSGDI